MLPLSGHHTQSNITIVEDVQRSFTRRLPGFNGVEYAQRLERLGLQSLEHRRLLADLLLCYKIIHGLVALNFDDFFFVFSPNSALRGHSLKLVVPISKCNKAKYFFSSRIVGVWNSLPDDVVAASSVYGYMHLSDWYAKLILQSF